MTGLNKEFDDAVHRLHDDHHVEEVVALGVPRHITVFGSRPLVGWAHIDADDSGYFTFIEDGQPALILPPRVLAALWYRTHPGSFCRGSNEVAWHCRTRSTARVQF